MQVTGWDPFTALARLVRDFDELIRRTWGEQAPARRAVTGFVPAVEATRDGNDVVVRFELPGMDVERDVEITVHEGRLIVAGERREEKTEGALVRELRYGSFRREFALPEGVGAEQVEASYDAGILTVLVHDVVRPQPQPVRVPVRGAVEAQSLESTTTTESDTAEAPEQPQS